MIHNIPVGYAILKCEICKYEIGMFDPRELKVPMRAEMFKPLRTGWPNPLRHNPALEHTQTWEAAICVACGHRPFFTRDHVLTPEGLFKVGGKVPRKETQADRNQAEIDRIWAEDQEKAKTVEEKNQEIINLSEIRGQNDDEVFRYQKLEVIPECPMFYCECGMGYADKGSLVKHKVKCKRKRKVKA